MKNLYFFKMVSEDEKTVLSGRLSAIRKTLGLNQKQLAELAEMDQGQLSNMERGKFRIQIDLLLALIQKKNVNINWLLTGEGPKFLPKKDGTATLHEDAEEYQTGSGIIERIIQRITDLEDWRAKYENSE